MAEVVLLPTERKELASAAVSGPPEPAETYVFPASFSQRRLWFLQQLEPDQTSYLVPMAWNLKGALDLDAVRFAINRIVERHDTLRTSFAVEHGEPVQVVHPFVPLEVDVLDLSDSGDPAAAANEIASIEANTPFDLAHEASFRYKVLRLPGEEFILLATVHHIVFDGWSKGVWIREFSAFYREFVTGESANLPELEIQYGDFAAWQQEQLSGQSLEDGLAFWTNALEGAPTLIDLPKDRPRTQVVSPEGATVKLNFDAELTAGLRRIALETNSTLFMVLLAGLHVLLARYSGQDEILVGTPIANRERLEVEPLIGFFVNTLIMRGSVKPDDSFLEVLSEVKRSTLDAYAHQDMPFEKLVEHLAPERSLSYNPLFQVLFALQNMARGSVSLPGVTIVPRGGGRLKTKLDMFVSILDDPQALRGTVEYSIALYDASTMERFAAHYHRLLEQLVADPAQIVGEISFLEDAEPRRLLREWNQTATSYPREQCLHQVFEEQALLSPEAEAVAFGACTLSYAELNQQANRLAHVLQARSVGPGSLVGVCLDRSEQLPVTLLAIMKTGAAYLPLDPNYPQERLAYILGDAKARLVLTQDAVLDLLPPFDGQALCLENLQTELKAAPEANPDALVDPEALAYVLHTSGSTGKPKGVEITQRNLVNFLCSMKQEPGMKPGDTLLAVTTLSFDISGLELYLPLISGARVVIATREQAIEATELMQLMDRWNVNVLQATPATWLMLLEAGWKGDRQLKALCGGEAMPPELSIKLATTCAELWNMYGPTETTIWSAVSRIAADAGGRISIGHPIANTTLHVLDSKRQFVPVGVLGELYIGGDGVGRGYWGKPDLTAERFMPDPFSTAHGAKMFRTGDMCRRRPDGQVEYVGRADHQVKIRGFRIELGEIEAALARMPAVQHCVVVAREDTPGDKRLAAYVVADPSYKAGAEENAVDSEQDQVSRWATAWDDSYEGGSNAADVTFNLAGWNSSYTGVAIPPQEMRHWVETTVDRILSLKPRRVWEIGCGTGLLLFRVAPQVERYHGTDISATALSALGKQVARPELELPQVTLAQRPAHEADNGSGEAGFDLVVLNSVIQYFPDADYLAQVLSRAVDSLGGEGSVFIGDVRNHALLDLFHTSVETFNAPDNLTRSQLRQRIEKTVRQDAELVVDPEFFHALKRKNPRISRVEIQLKRGSAPNELTRFRYDVTLHVDKPVESLAGVAWLDWTSQSLTPALLRSTLETSKPNVLALTRIPNAQLQFDVAVTAALAREEGPATIGEVRQNLLGSLPDQKMQPEVLWQTLEGLPYHLELRPSRNAADGTFDALLVRTETPAANLPAIRFPGESDVARNWQAYCNNPLQQSFGRALVPKLREWLAERLPDYMVPSAIVLLDAMPLSSAGKINRKALPQPEYTREEDVPYIAPRSEVEVQLAAIWSEALHVPNIGVADNFFSLGGHSLLGTQIVSRIRKVFQIELPLRVLFESPTLEGLAATVQALCLRTDTPSLPPLVRVNRGPGPQPVSFAQQRFWFLNQLDPTSSMHNVAPKWRLRGAFDQHALTAALDEIVARHEVLRTTYATDGTNPVQIIAPPGPCSLTIDDLTMLAPEEREAEARLLAGRETRTPFDLEHGPIFRARLIKLDDDDHVLVLNTHHIATDGWSSGILRQEFSALYGAFASGQPSPLPPLALQYTDFAVWQRTHVEGEALETQLAYWKEHLRDAPPSIELPTDRPRPPVQTHRGATRGTTLPNSLLESLKTLSQGEGATLFMTLLAAYYVLLSRYSGQKDIVVGTAIAGRTHSDTESLIGLFVNSLALRAKLGEDLTFRDLLAQVRQTTVNAYANQDVPFERLVEEINPVRDSSRSPLYQVMLVLQNTPSDRSVTSGLDITGFGTVSETAQMDLLVNLSESAAGLSVAFNFNTDLFDAATIERMLAHYGTLLSQLAENAAQKIAEVSFLSEAERHRMLVEWNDTAADYPRDKCVHQLFEEHAANTPDARALIFQGRELSYLELNTQANRLAHYLRARGVERGGRVGVYLERSVAMIVTLMAIQKCGAAYVPLDPDYPADRIRVVMEDAATSCMVTQDLLLNRLPEYAGPVIALERDAVAIAAQSSENPSAGATSDDVIYVLFTSGSTGRPKGVAVSHRNVVNVLHWMAGELDIDASDVTLAIASYGFDMSAPEFYVPLMTGGAILLAPPYLAASGEDLARFCNEHQPSFIVATPTTWSSLLDAGYLGKGIKRMTGGEAISRDLLHRLITLSDYTPLFNGYGPTETTACSTFHRFTHPDEPVVVGRPLANSQVYLLDTHRQLVPVGVVGGIYIAGDGVSKGYLGRPDLTTEKFTDNPFSSSSKLYYTGDIGRFLPDGRIEYLGRADHQVKIRGLRIELEEIEAVLARQPAVKECVVIAREDEPGEKRLAAYIVASCEVQASELRTWLAARLPEYMVPAAFVLLDAMPLSANGKIERHALPAPEYAQINAEAHVDPRTDREVQLAAIWAEVLKLPQVSVEANFFALGGHSLLATQVVSRIRRTFEVELPLRALFETPTVAGLAAAIEEITASSRTSTAAALRPADRGRPIPLSFAQQRLWFLQQLDPGSSMYNVTPRWRLRGSLDHIALTGALDEIVARHEVFRTTYVTQGASPVQVIAAPASCPLTIDDLSMLAPNERESRARLLVGLEARMPLDLEHGPLFRARLIKLDDDDHVLVLSTHHIATDGWSAGILRREFSVLYSAFASGRPSPLAPLPLQYADYAVWQRTHVEGEALETQLAYWKENLRDAPPSVELPTDRPRPAIQTFQGARCSLELSQEVLGSLKRLGHQEGVTLFMTLLSAFSVLLSRYSGQEDIVIGTAIAGRTHSDTEGMIGLFVNTLALRARVGDHISFRDLLAQVRETTVNAYANQDVPFERLVEEINPIRDSSRSPLYQVMLVLQNAPSDKGLVAGLEISGFATTTETSQMDLLLNLSEHARGLTATFNYNTDLFDAASMERMLGHFRVLLESIVESAAQNPATPAHDLPLLTAGELQQLWSGGAGEPVMSPEACLHGFFERQAERSPNALACVAGTSRLAYAQLNTRANQVAHYLQARGAGPDVPVAIYCERNLNLLVGILGILKSGSAYVPLDPMYPSERIEHIVEAAHSTVVLTQSSLADQLPASAGERILLDADWDSIALQPANNPNARTTSSSLAYVLFTSGSTGRPKGVALEHRSATTFVAWARTVYTADELAGVLFSTSVCFDLSVFEIFVTLSSGGAVVVAENALYLPTLEARDEVTLINTVPSAIAELVRSGGVPDSVRTVNLAGEALRDDLVEQIYAKTHVIQVYNLYGPTEDTTYSTFTPVLRGTTVTIGVPIANTQAYVLDRQRRMQPVGVPGELYLAGDGLARGYYGQPDRTAECFVPNSFSTAPDARMYRTGDLCRWATDGHLHYMGRLDNQVKLRGFRIELGEIEVALGEQPDVIESAVVVREDVPGDKRLVAYISATSPLDHEALRVRLRSTLPEYMVPAAFVQLDRLPLTPNGKLDRGKLPAPLVAEPGTTGDLPSTRIEILLAEIWSDILRVPCVRRGDDFFALGGHSLLATQMVSRVRQHFLVVIPLVAIFAHTTLEAFARLLEAVQPADSGSALVPISTANRPSRLPLSFGQQRFWFFDQLEPGSSMYNVAFKWRLRGALDRRALTDALAEIVSRHEVLRTTYVMDHGAPAQVVAPPGPCSFTVDDLTTLPEYERESQARRVASVEAHLPFDLQHGPMFRARLVKLADEDHVLVLSTHHIAIDGWSSGILRREFCALYAAYSAAQPSPLPPLPLQYVDYALWQRTHLEGPSLDAQLAYWKEHLRDAPPSIDLPTDRTRPIIQTFRGARCSIDLSLDLLERLKTLGQGEGATLFMTLLSAFYVLLSRYSGQEDIVVGTAIAGRTHSDTESLIGLFVNTLALRAKVGDRITFRDLLAQVRRTTVEAYARQDVPFERLVEAINPVRDSSRSPLYQVMLVLQNTPSDKGAVAGLEISGFGTTTDTSQMDLLLNLSEHPRGLTATFNYNTDLFNASTMERMLDHFRVLLEGVAETATDSEDRPAHDLPLLTAVELERLWGGGASTPVKNPATTLHKLFELQVMRSPNALACICGSAKLTYAQLNARANQVAHYLQGRGAGPDVPVAIYCERNLDLLVGVLGILKSGSAYVPLDPMYPRERIECILEDAHAAVVLTQTALADQLPSGAGERILLDADRGVLDQQAVGNPNAQTSESNLAYVLFTSGSTGRPKGVAIEHRSATTFVTWARTVYTADELSGVLFSTSVCFDLSVFEIFVTLSSGGAIVVVENALYLPSVEARSQVTLINTVPSAIAELVRSGGVPDSVRTVNLAGEALRDDLVEQIYLKSHVTQVYNLYGPTEDTTYSTFTPVSRGVPVTIGTPIANTQAFVLDRQRRLQPDGVPGELYLAGDGLARGYFGQPERTAERFVPNPFVSEPDARMYRTGDLCRWTEDGQLQYLGRLDNQVKVRGFRIELGEIEVALAALPGVTEATVIVREDTIGDPRIVAYIVSSESLDAPSLRLSLKAKLPDYMVPAAFVQLDSLPLTPNGKLDRSKLPAPLVVSASNTAGHLPSVRMEVLLAEIWKEVLGIDTVHLEDDFFALGGHSLMAAAMIANLSDSLGYRVRLSSLFESPTLGALAHAADLQGRQHDRIKTVVPIRRSGTKPPIFCVSRPNVNALGFVFLSRTISSEIPVYGLQSNMDNDGMLVPFTQQEYEDKAREYIEAMREVQPEGPYFLAGYCEGAHIAFEMARQLEMSGLEVGKLFILDVWPVENTIGRTRFRLRNYAKVLDRFLKTTNRERLAMISRKWYGLPAVPPTRAEVNGRVLRDALYILEHRKGLTTIAAERYWPGKDFKPTIYNGDIVVFRLDRQPFQRIRDKTLGWASRITGKVQLIRVPGEHELILRDPGVSAVARGMEAEMNKYLAKMGDAVS